MPPTTKAQSHSLVRLAVNVPAQSKTQARTRPRYSGTIRKSDIAAAAVVVTVSEKEFWFSPSFAFSALSEHFCLCFDGAGCPDV